MNRQELILKLRQGYVISRKDYDTAKADYEAALAGASEDLKAQALAYLQSVLNKQSADPRSNKHARHTGAEAYRIATTMLNGTFDPAAVASPLNTDSGIDTRRKDYGRAGNVAVDFYLKNNAEKAKNDLIQSSNQASSKGRYSFDALYGIDSLSMPLGATRGSLILNYASKLLNNIQAAENAENLGKIVYGKINGMYADKSRLEALLRPDTDRESETAYNELLDIASKYDTKEHWSKYFGNTIPTPTAENTNFSNLRARGYTEVNPSDQYTRSILGKRNLKLLIGRDNKYKLVNSDYSDYSGGPFVDYNDDWTVDTDELRESRGYGKGIVVDETGNIHVGNMSDLDEGSLLGQAYKNVKNERYANREKIIPEYKWSQRYTDSNSPALNKIAEQIGTNFTGADVSALFRGSDRILAVVPSDQESVFEENSFRFKPDVKFYVYDSAGDIVEKSFDDLKDKYNQDGFGETITEDQVYDLYDGLLRLNTYYRGETMNKTKAYNMLKALLKSNKNEILNNDERTLLLEYLQGAQDSSGKIIPPDVIQASFLKAIYDQDVSNTELGEEGNELIKELIKEFFSMMRTNNAVPLDKSGGNIQFAKKGEVLDAYGRSKNKTEYISSVREKLRNTTQLTQELQIELETEARRRGYKSLRHYKHDQEAYDLTTSSDRWRLATLAQDATSLLASFAPGVGTGVAGAMGIGSTITDAIADFKDPNVSFGNALTNIFYNLGFAGLGMIPGAKLGKFAKGVKRWLPRIMTAIAAKNIALDESTLKTLDKIAKGNLSLTREDVRNLSHVLSLAAGISRGGRQAYENRKVSRLIKKENKITLKDLNDKSKTFTEDQISAVNTKLSKIQNGKDAKKNAVDILKEDLKLNDDEANLVLNGILAKYSNGRIGTYKISKEDTEIISLNSYEKLRDLWNREAETVENSNAALRWWANNVGGGSYTAKLRAILRHLSKEDRAKLMDFEGRNWMINWGDVRGKSGNRPFFEINTETPKSSINTNPQTYNTNMQTYMDEMSIK